MPLRSSCSGNNRQLSRLHSTRRAQGEGSSACSVHGATAAKVRPQRSRSFSAVMTPPPAALVPHVQQQQGAPEEEEEEQQRRRLVLLRVGRNSRSQGSSRSSTLSAMAMSAACSLDRASTRTAAGAHRGGSQLLSPPYQRSPTPAALPYGLPQPADAAAVAAVAAVPLTAAGAAGLQQALSAGGAVWPGPVAHKEAAPSAPRPTLRRMVQRRNTLSALLQPHRGMLLGGEGGAYGADHTGGERSSRATHGERATRNAAQRRASMGRITMHTHSRGAQELAAAAAALGAAQAPGLACAHSALSHRASTASSAGAELHDPQVWGMKFNVVIYWSFAVQSTVKRGARAGQVC